MPVIVDVDNFDQRNPEIEAILKRIGHFIGGQLPEGWGFNLLLFDFGANGSTFYISNAVREDMLKVMQEFIDNQEAQV